MSLYSDTNLTRPITASRRLSQPITSTHTLQAPPIKTRVGRCCHVPGAGWWQDADEGLGHQGKIRVTREVTLEERLNCGPDDTQPPNRVNTTHRVARLREEMVNKGLDAYLIPTDDEHQSEYVAPRDERRRYLSGFSGSAGMAVVTAAQQALWTDGRYFLQADQQLHCDWLLMKQKNTGVPKMVEWLRQNLVEGSKVGADPRLIGAETWMSYAEDLAKANIQLVAEETNLVDLVWPEDERSPESDSPIFIHELAYAGKKWEDKVAEVRAEMIKAGADLLVVTALDEVAWLFNLRGNDIPYNPVFKSYVIITRNGVDLYIPSNKITPAVDLHLHINHCDGQECVTINEYNSVLNRLRALKISNDVKKVMMGGKYSYSGGASYAVYSAVPEELRLKVTSPVLLMKARKNQVESQGMVNSHIRDAVALCDFLAYLEYEVKDGRYWSELSASEKLKEYRAQQRDFMGISFTTISAFGPNGAVIHYQPTRETNLQITNQSLYLLDSGGQYKDGTTDVTRTLHYGQPTPFQVEAYTRVLKGAVDLAALIFPQGTGDTDVDIIARRYLYEAGLDYRHGTGHGIGHFLNVHEAPIQVRIYGSEEHEFEVGHYFSDEPGYYKDNEFGIRLENILTVVEKETKYQFDKQSLGFDPITLVPFEPILINASMLSAEQCHWINKYHTRVREVVGSELVEQNRTRGYEWVQAKTEPLPCPDTRHVNSAGVSRWRRSAVEKNVTLEERSHCDVNATQPDIRVNTSTQVEGLRQEMLSRNLAAYIIPISGEQYGYTLEAERRLQYMTGFTGSAGMAVVTDTQQALWTDGRYFLQGDSELDCDWLLMKKGQDGVPTMTEWLRSTLSGGVRVGADPRLLAADTWKTFAEDLAKSEMVMVAEETNLVDLVWPTERPPYPQQPIYIHDLQFAGKKWEKKVAEVRSEMIKAGADLLVVTAMDEVAWLLNLRGSDVPTTPVFRGYVVVSRGEVELFLPSNKITAAVDLHLNINQCGDQECVVISPYSTILDRLRALKVNANITKVLLGSKYSYSGGASYAVYSAVPEEKREVAVSPVLLMKARKSEVEAQGMKNAHLRDAVAVCDFLAFMEREITSGQSWDEIEAAAKLSELREQQKHYTGPSFTTISAFGPNGAVIHYRPRPDTNLEITKDSLYLVDSGGQYKDGTTDVTRTMHYGQPTPMQVEAYTRVLMGAIDLATLVFPQGTGDTDVDIVARSPLYEAGLDYRHGTGHGIGHFLGVHEAPTQVRIYSKEEHELEVSQFFSDEPGYYQDGEWGIRLETILTVVPTQTKFLGFEAVTLVPFEAKLIDLSLLSDKQCEWLNKYHARVLDIVGPVLVSQGRQQAYDWLVNKTEPLRCPGHSTTPVAVAPITSTSTQKTAEKTQTPYASGSTARQQSISRHANPPVSSTTKVLSAGAHVASSSFCLLVLSITLLVGNLRWR
ncbi:hypothetical protein Pmani_026085 [Petrolisthes manimaculis]|uniref:Uncharacterized protein n=1 Tax=Petrolisthes manimaculis TaxID=1843537 RepID=A0AAE1TX10_9EUCA|nr:hypothetical protein Pmani_026085 [Petrolisthes manimaculis]